MRILLLRTWKTNIGNGFIDKGAKAALEEAFPKANITEISGYSGYVQKNVEKGYLAGFQGEKVPLGTTLKKIKEKKSKNLDFVSVGDLINLDTIDIAVLPGCVLYEHAFERYKTTLKRLKEEEIPLLILGGGGGNYTEDTKEYVTSFLKGFEKLGLITRDRDAYKTYQDSLDVVKDGIDNAFFISDWYNPPKAAEQFIVKNFDKTEEPQIKTEKDIIRTSHTPFGEPYGSPINRIFSDKYRVADQGFFISDSLKDYLFIYKNAETVYSDRVHACVPALVYGNKAQFIFETPRSGLFNRVGVEWKNKPVSMDKNKITNIKNEQVSRIKDVVNIITSPVNS